jgi:hypothetical protein
MAGESISKLGGAGAAGVDLAEAVGTDPRAAPRVGEWVEPWDVPNPDSCHFYHSYDLPEFGEVTGDWDLRGSIDAYLGNGTLQGKTFLETGTASGFVSMEAEKRGAKVISFDVGAPRRQMQFIPFVQNSHMDSRLRESVAAAVTRVKRSYWLAHRLLGSDAKVYYGDIFSLSERLYPVDVVHVGQILVHLRDPLGALAEAGKLAKERIVIVEGSLPTEEPIARLIAKPDAPKLCRSWWHISVGFYRTYLGILGFEIESIDEAEHYCPVEGEAMLLKTITAVRTQELAPDTSTA